MKRIYGMAAGIALLAMSGAAQDTPADRIKLELADRMKQLERLVATSKMVSAGGGVMGTTVKGAPYSGQEINETTQVLGDGTRIHNESRSKVFRDGEGRVRREVGDQVTIWDPVAKLNYTLNTKDMTAVKSPMGVAMFTRSWAAPGAGAAAGGRVGFAETVRLKDGTVTVTRDGKTETFPAGQDSAWTSADKVKAKLKQAAESDAVAYAPATASTFSVVEDVVIAKDGKKTTTALPEEGHFIPGDRFDVAVPMVAGTLVGGTMAFGREAANFKTDALGEQVMEGVKVRGVKQTSTIEAGAIGNDRPIATVSERWTSDDLQTDVLTRRNDPRMGEQTFRLININRGEPGAFLFQVPSGYTLTDRR